MSAPMLGTGKAVVLEKVGQLSALDFYREHKVVLRSQTAVEGITKVLFRKGDDLVGTVPLVLDTPFALELDARSIAERAMSDDPFERSLGVALMHAVRSGGFNAPRAAVIRLTAPEHPDTLTVTFKPRAWSNMGSKTVVSLALAQDQLLNGRDH